MKKIYPCPCCGFFTLSECSPGSYEICPVCNWEDDLMQFYNIDSSGGANKVSLREAKKNYKEFGASSKRFVNEVRKPIPEEFPENN